jgi:hypothetical protein
MPLAKAGRPEPLDAPPQAVYLDLRPTLTMRPRSMSFVSAGSPGQPYSTR